MHKIGFFVMMTLGACKLGAEPVTLSVNVKGFSSDKGMAEVALFNDAAAFPTKPEKALMKLRAPISGGAATVKFEGVPPGTYAVSVYHDVNNNGRMDSNFLGIPKEPTGASNDAKGKMGPPSFKDAQFAVSSDRTVNVNVR